MAKNKRQQQKETSLKPAAIKTAAVVSRRGKKVIGVGVALVLLGFWVLTYVDPAGQNAAGTLAPLLLVLGYALIGVGIILPDPAVSDSSATLPPA